MAIIEEREWFVGWRVVGGLEPPPRLRKRVGKGQKRIQYGWRWQMASQRGKADRGAVMSNSEWSHAWKAICERVKSVTSEDSPIIFSNYRTDNQGNPVDDLDTIAIRGKAIIVADAADEIWAGQDSQPFESRILIKPTWLDLCAVLHEQIQSTRDTHHVCVEGVERVGQKTIDGKRISKYALLLGS